MKERTPAQVNENGNIPPNPPTPPADEEQLRLLQQQLHPYQVIQQQIIQEQQAFLR